MSWRCCNKTCPPARKTLAEIPSGLSALLPSTRARMLANIRARWAPLMNHVSIVTQILALRTTASCCLQHSLIRSASVSSVPSFAKTDWSGLGAEVRTSGCTSSTQSKAFQRYLAITSKQLVFQQGERTHVPITMSTNQESMMPQSESRERWAGNV